MEANRTILVASPSVSFRTKDVSIMKKYIFILSDAVSYDLSTDYLNFNFQVGNIPDTDGDLTNLVVTENTNVAIRFSEFESLVELPTNFDSLSIKEKLKVILKDSFKTMAEYKKIYQFEQFDLMSEANPETETE